MAWFSSEPPQPHFTPEAFEEVLRGNYPSPWRPETFLQHTKAEQSEESVCFWMESEALAQLAAGKSPPPLVDPEEFFLVPKSDRGEPTVWTKKVLDTYIKPNAAHEINISSETRDQALQLAQAGDLDPRNVLTPAKREVTKLMFQDSFARFTRKAVTQNVSESAVSIKLRNAAVFGFLALLFTGLCLGLQAPRWVLFAAFPLWVVVIHEIVSIRTKLCSLSAALGVGFLGRHFVPVSCTVCRDAHRRRGRRQLALVSAAALVVTCACFALTYIIEAGQGREMYS